jgi:hypothetical protein
MYPKKMKMDIFFNPVLNRIGSGRVLQRRQPLALCKKVYLIGIITPGAMADFHQETGVLWV